ncbi:hypothetical protein QKQ66_gp070 [Dione juno nucleopolyhedrovirus]|uniref:Uncharacterized protein n=1 Tax=Dione juno nucleopolyhedrovirus TaxID=2594175 RepID=A0AAE6H376_9ABAC|nr:hypothetical protein QKQ66_gp070 [Dione juno nucleopolyhedrovirus]QDL57038.1 hypothetical protein DijuNPV-ORF-70 [Dione juno nucleopolyhedrovirus]
MVVMLDGKYIGSPNGDGGGGGGGAGKGVGNLILSFCLMFISIHSVSNIIIIKLDTVKKTTTTIILKYIIIANLNFFCIVPKSCAPDERAIFDCAECTCTR